MSDKSAMVREAEEAFSGRHEAMIPALGSVARDEAPYPPGTYDDFDAWNARFVEGKTGVKAAEVVAVLDATHRRFVGAAGALGERHFAAGGAARDPVDGAGAAHYREHAAQIREWRARAS